MRLTFIGVGEAFDPAMGTSSTLIETNDYCVMVDCGYASLDAFYNCGRNCNDVDAIYLTHFHADHTFGIPALLGRFMQEKREKPLLFLGQRGTETYIRKLITLAYPGLIKTLTFRLDFSESDIAISAGPFELEFAQTVHPLKNMAARFTTGSTVLGVSGDGSITGDVSQLFEPCTAVIHETFTFAPPFPGHGAFETVLEHSSRWPGLEYLFLTHISRSCREEMVIAAKKHSNLGFQIEVPCPGQVVVLNN
jgi:ribonuclease BN (tRNA processing enzyme)